ncbi:tyrosine-type recombinase/integrase [Fodinibius sp. AD559]|uniref:tyrosine-type recombinase/integrase n=1 Tax=Fodinibius sp. AD559 TaxID=3424179 RepID=UPI0040470298
MPATFHYYLREQRANHKGECPIYLRITCNRKIKYYNTGIRVSPSDWRDDKEEVRRTHATYNKLNEELDILLAEAKKAARVLRRNNKESAVAIRDRLIGASKENFFIMANEELEELERNDQFYLKKQTNATLSKLKEFNGSENLLFTEINSDFLSRFQDWMQQEKGNKGTTIRKNMSDMRRILERARDANLLFNDPFDGVKPVKRGDPAPKVKLTHKQIQAMANLSLPEGSNEWNARNVFVLAFYLNGVRFGDMAKLTWGQINNGRLSYRMSKTGSVMYFPIPEPGKKILDKYRDSDKTDDAYVFPFLDGLSKQERKDKTLVENNVSSSLVLVNKAIKEVGKQADIKESIADQISTHVARHSFAQYLVNKGVSIYEISRQLRHSKVSTTENYLDRLGLQAKDQTMDNPFN